MKIITPKGIYKYNPKYLYTGGQRINKIISKENLLLFKKIADKVGLRYGLTWGTFLGALREKDFIEHDEDIDLFIRYEDKDLFLSMLFELRDNGFELIRYDRRETLASIMRKGEYIDLYLQKPVAPGFRESHGYPIPENFILNLALYDFQGSQFYGAKDNENFMVYLYGENWLTPIQYANFEMNSFRKVVCIFRSFLMCHLPDFLFYGIIHINGSIKWDIHDKRQKRLNDFLAKK